MAPRSEVPQDRIAKTWFWDETLLSAVNDQIQAQLAQGQKIAASHGLVDFSSVVVTGNRVSSAIASYAKEKEFDHIVMGTGVTNDLERLFLGSVAKDCDCQSSKICHQLSPQSNEKSHPPIPRASPYGAHLTALGLEGAHHPHDNWIVGNFLVAAVVELKCSHSVRTNKNGSKIANFVPFDAQ